MITEEQLRYIYKNEHNTKAHIAIDRAIHLYYNFLVIAMDKFQINTPARIASFIAQVGHESACFLFSRELASGAAYDVGQLAINLGNTPEDDGDGERYKGRGLIQITGTTNYKLVSQALGVDFITNPELLESPQYAVMSACWFWNWRNLNSFADKPSTWTAIANKGKKSQRICNSFEYITYRINGGWNGLEDRTLLYERAKAAIK